MHRTSATRSRLIYARAGRGRSRSARRQIVDRNVETDNRKEPCRVQIVLPTKILDQHLRGTTETRLVAFLHPICKQRTRPPQLLRLASLDLRRHVSKIGSSLKRGIGGVWRRWRIPK